MRAVVRAFGLSALREAAAQALGFTAQWNNVDSVNGLR